MKNLVFLLFFQLGWFLCVLAPSMGTTYAGIFLMALYILVVLRFVVDPGAAFLRILLIGTIGATVDGIVTTTGWYEFPGKALWTPIYLYAIWYGFAATIETTLCWLKRRYVLASLLGAVFGPLNYLAGQKFGAVSFPNSVDDTMVFIGFLWAIELPLLLWISTAPSAALQIRSRAVL